MGLLDGMSSLNEDLDSTFSSSDDSLGDIPSFISLGEAINSVGSDSEPQTMNAFLGDNGGSYSDYSNSQQVIDINADLASYPQNFATMSIGDQHFSYTPSSSSNYSDNSSSFSNVIGSYNKSGNHINSTQPKHFQSYMQSFVNSSNQPHTVTIADYSHSKNNSLEAYNEQFDKINAFNNQVEKDKLDMFNKNYDLNKEYINQQNQQFNSMLELYNNKLEQQNNQFNSMMNFNTQQLNQQLSEFNASMDFQKQALQQQETLANKQLDFYNKQENDRYAILQKQLKDSEYQFNKQYALQQQALKNQTNLMNAQIDIANKNYEMANQQWQTTLGEIKHMQQVRSNITNNFFR